MGTDPQDKAIGRTVAFLFLLRRRNKQNILTGNACNKLEKD